MSELATITSLGFSIFSTYSGRGVTAARRDVNDLTGDLERNRVKLGQSAGAFFSLSSAAMSLGPALIPIGTVMAGVGASTVAMATASGAALGAYGVATAGAIKNTLAMAKAHKELTPIQQTFVNNVHQMKAAMDGVSSGTMNLTLHTATLVVQGLTSVIKGMVPVIKAVAPVVDEVANAFKKWAAGDGLQRFVTIVVKSGVPALHNLFDAARSVLGFLGDGFRALAPTIIPVSKAIADGAANLKKWADAGGFANFLTTVHNNAPAVKEFFIALGQALKNVGVAMAGLGPASLSLATILLKIVAAMPPSWIQAIVVGFMAFRAVMLTMAIISFVSSAIAVLQVVLGTLNFVLVALGITWNVFFGWLTVIILAVAALVVGIIFLVQNWNTVWNAIKQTAMTVWNFLTHGLGMLVLALLGPVGVLIILGTHWRDVWNGMKIVAMAVWTGLGVAWRAFVTGLTVAWNAVSLGLRAAWNAVWNAMGVAARAIWTALGVAWRAFVIGLSTIWNATSAALRATWNALWAAMTAVARAAWAALTAGWNALSAAFRATMNALNAAFRATWNAMWAAIRATANAAWAALKASWNAFSSAFRATANALSAAFKATWNAMWAAIRATANAAWAALKASWNAFSAAFRATANALSTAFKATWTAMWNAIKSIANAAWTALKNSFNAFRSAFMSATNALMGALKNAWGAGAKAIGAAWSAIKKLVRDPIQAVVNVVYNNGIVKLWNVVAGVFGAPKLSSFNLPGFATGGAVNGPGTATSDSVVARLSAGEHVWTAKEVAAAGGHDNVLRMREEVMGSRSYKAARNGNKEGGFALGGIIPDPGDILGSIGGFFSKAFKIVGGVASAAFSLATGFGGDIISHLKDLAMGQIAGIVNPLIQKAANVGKDTVKGIIPGSPWTEQLIAGGGKVGVVSTGGANPQDVSAGAQGGLANNGGGIIQKMADYIKAWITANDVPVGGGNTAEAQKWADAQVGKPYSLGGNFGTTFDCSQFMSGITQIILGKKPSPLYTTFAFTGAKQGPATFEKDLKAPFMVGVTNAGVGHMAGTLNGKNYEATPPRVRSGPGARGYNDPMFPMHYGMKASIGGGQGVIPAGQHKAIIDAALAAAHVPPPGTLAQWEAGLNTLITRESNWNSSAVNGTDSNAAAGHPSKGLAQVIQPTFDAYHVAGTSSNILDPIANVAAAIRYIVARYGNITNVQQANASLPPKGYRHGTQRAHKGWHMIDEEGGEWINFRGGEKVLPHGRTPTPASDGGAVVVQVTNHWHGNPTKEAVQYAEGGMAEKLRQACAAGVGKRPN